MTDPTEPGAESSERVPEIGAAITAELAGQFALILSAGLPELDAIAYMRPDLEGHALKYELKRWLRAKTVQAAIVRQQGKAWQAMTIDERIKFSVDKQYTEMAYYLFRNNYNDLEGPQRSKADTCRQALEAKIAGMAGKMDALSQFWADVQAGKVKLSSQAVQ